MEQLSLSGEKIWAPETTECSWRWQADSRTSYFGVTVFSKSFWPTTSFRQYFPPAPPTPTPHFVLFPLLIALYFSSLCPISVLSFWESDIRKLQDHSPQLMRPCSLWLVMAHFDGWQPEVGEACLTHTVQTLVQQALPDRRFMRVIEVYTSYSVVTGRPIIPANSSLFSCCLFLFQVYLSLLLLTLPWSLYLDSCPFHPENFFCVSLSFCHWYLCFM